MLTNRLSFTLPDFTRIVWASAQAREVWAPRLSRITAAWDAIERWSVVDGVRHSALQSVAPEHLAGLTREMAARGLVVLPLDRNGAGVTYSASASSAVDGQPWVYRVAITRPQFIAAWVESWGRNGDATIGSLLGFPPCCRGFFLRTWKAGSVDPTGHMTGFHTRVDGAREVADQDPHGNILLRWLGVRLVTHMPCSFHCYGSRQLGRAFADVGRKHGYAEEVGWILDMLSWPIEWSALHGIAEIKTPILKIATRTDATASKVIVRCPGESYPLEGATGNVFPYRKDKPARVIPIASLRTPAFERDPRENGFPTLHAEFEAHDMVLRALLPAPRGTVVDLGCGNGWLLHRIKGALQVPTVGLEVDAAKSARHAPGVDVRAGSIADVARLIPEPVAVALVSQRRFDEGFEPVVRAWARERGALLLVYSYDEPQFARLEAR